MSKKRGVKKRSKGRSKVRQKRQKTKQFWWVSAILTFVVLVLLFAAERTLFKSDPGESIDAKPSENRENQVIIGEWVRPDGGYILKITGVEADGKVDAGYFNPRSINVSQAKVTADGGSQRLFIELKDKGYPGSTYNLIYNADRDALVGIYYQAVMKQSFEVVFVRKK